MTGRVNSSGRCPTLKELPPGIPGKTGWPWTEESPQLPSTMPDGYQWPRISIITPSLNQGEFIEETIRSVLLQGYPNLEYIIMDGGSTDGSIEIINKYEKWIAYWVTEADKGQSHAINKGVLRASGDILAWINSDDIYTYNIFSKIIQAMYSNPNILRPIVYGNAYRIDATSKITGQFLSSPSHLITFTNLVAMRHSLGIHQPSVFIAAYLFKQNLLNENLRYVMDYDLWIRLSLHHSFYYVPLFISQIRFHEKCKSAISIRKGRISFIKETKAVSKVYWDKNITKQLYYWSRVTSWSLRRKLHGLFEMFLFFVKLNLCNLFSDTTLSKLKMRHK
jgi:glycosyltransferase involved in cell wall biosynthesis